MNSSDIDIGPLSWVKSEIDLALERAGAELIAYAHTADTATLAAAADHLHQAHGALTIVGLDGIVEFSGAIEQTLQALAEERAPRPDLALDAAGRALAELRGHLDGLMAGHPNQPLRLYDIYAELITAAGKPAPDRAELFFPDLSQRPPRREREPVYLAGAALTARLKAARLGFDRALIKWIKGDPRGTAEMRASTMIVEATRRQPAARAYWWAAVAALDAIDAGGFSDPDQIQNFAMRVDSRIKKLIEGEAEVPPQFLREALYMVATSAASTPRVEVARGAYRLADLIPNEHSDTAARRIPHLKRLRELLPEAKEHWNRLCEGVAAALPGFHERAGQLAQVAAATEQTDFARLLDAVRIQADRLRRDPSLHSEALGIEVATALLLAETALDHFGELEADFGLQVDAICRRLEAAAAGETLDSLDMPHLDAMSRRAEERQLLETVSREIAANLGTVEQALDAYFRDPSRQNTLTALKAPIRQIEGAFAVLGQDRANAVLGECEQAIDRFAAAGTTPDQADFEDVARKLSALGFFIERMRHGAADIDAILNPPAVAEDPAPIAEDTSVPAIETTAPAPLDGGIAAAAAEAAAIVEALAPLTDEPLPVAPAPVPPPSATAARLVDASHAEVDAELLAIFLEEAHEVLATLGEHLPRLHRSPDDHECLTVIRRNYHTLKGSGRMVGLTDLGEAAWAVEQTLNRWLQESRSASGDLLAMLDQADALFADWVAELAAGGHHAPDGVPLIEHCAVLRGEASAPVAPAAPAFAAAAVIEPSAEATPDLVAAPVAAPEPAPPAATAELAALDISALDLPTLDLPEPVAPKTDDTAPVSVEPLEATLPEAALLETALPEPVALAPVLPDATPLVPVPPDAELPEPELSAPVPAEPERLLPTPESAEDGGSDADASVADTAGDGGEVVSFPAPPSIQIGHVEVAPTLYRLYLDETRDHIATLQRELGHEGVPGDAVIRAAHTSASISAATGFEAIHVLARALELALERFAQSRCAPNEAQRLTLARAAGALEGMLGAVGARRLPADQPALAAELGALQPLVEVAASEPVDEPPAIEPLPETPPALPAGLELAAIAAPDAGELESDRRGRRIEDELDPQLLPLFLEESVDLMREISEGLRAWRATPGDDAPPRQLQRALHTLKGSARMAGAMGIGELLHAMETRVEQAQTLRAAQPATFDELDASGDRAAMLIERLRNPVAEPAPVAAPVAARAEIAAGPAPAFAGQAAQPQLRVRADLVDTLVNEAGEIAIARSRIEGEMLGFKSSLLDLTENIIRLRKQVREIEIQAESQMQSRQAHATEHEDLFDPLEFDRFTRFQELTRMLAESVNDVATVQHNLLLNLDHADAALTAQARLNRELSKRLMSVRMVPFDSLAERLHRVVRQAAKECERRANLDIRSGQTELDRSVIDHMVGPLEHLLRNSVVHGIGDADNRVAAGKSPIGQITVALAQEGNEVVISITDDGGGLDFPRIRARAIEQGLLSAGAEPAESELTALIFEPGFSTAAELTELAGRGVGMDVVKSETTALGGRIEVESVSGVGATFRIFLPLTLAVTQGVLVLSGGRRFVIPASMVEQVSELKPSVIEVYRSNGAAEWLGRRYPWHYLPAMLGAPEAVPIPARRHWLLLIKGGTERLALEVDGLIGNQEVVVKPIGPQLSRVPGIAGATVLGDGEIALIINPVALTLSATSLRPMEQTPPTASQIIRVARLPTVMVVDDSLTVRKITGRLLARQGYEVVTAKDGVDALEHLGDLLPDVMLVDIEMPRMDGFDLTRAVRADARLKSIPIIMITSRTADKHRDYARQIGVDHYLGKPYDEEQLLSLVRQYCAGKEARK